MHRVKPQSQTFARTSWRQPSNPAEGSSRTTPSRVATSNLSSSGCTQHVQDDVDDAGETAITDRVKQDFKLVNWRAVKATPKLKTDKNPEKLSKLMGTKRQIST
jgi:hypothetical protein